MKPLHLLLIEDSPTYAQLVRSMLAKANVTDFEVQCSDTLSGGIELLGQHEFDAILLDLGLPDSEGLDTLKRISAVATSIPILILSSHDEEEVTLKALHFGAADYLVKSEVTINWLGRSIVYAIERNRAISQAALSGKKSKSPKKTSVLSTSKAADGTLIVDLAERRLVNIVELEAVKDTLLNLIERENSERLLLDFHNVEYVSNIAIAVLLKVHKKLQSLGCDLVLDNVSAQVYECFATRRFDRVFEIRQSN